MADFNSKKINVQLPLHKFRDKKLNKNSDKREFNALKGLNLIKTGCIFAFVFCTNLDIQRGL